MLCGPVPRLETSAPPFNSMPKLTGSQLCAILRARSGPCFPRYAQYSALTGVPARGLVLREGMFFTIEPMLNLGKPAVKILGDGWTAVTRDRTLSAQYEHSVGVTADGVEIFTKSPGELDTPHRIQDD